MTDLDAIRERDAELDHHEDWASLAHDRSALLAYIDGLAEAVGALPWTHTSPKGGQGIDRAAVLAILRGE
jgi:hypothetical protein